MANGSMSSNSNGEGDIRSQIVEADLVSCMIALPTPALPQHRHPGLPLVLRQGQDEGQAGLHRPLRSGALHRRPRARLHGRPC
ncbi:N-6 DNA methylase [Aeromicrobium sp. UC242_57]|uniref:N-6 DNA methylase n=1 Tax=Aeromicrobium sp. UC242_57 TaxID=3374624 RepID=UPI00378BD7E5